MSTGMAMPTQTLGQLADDTHALDDRVVADQSVLTADTAADVDSHARLVAGVTKVGFMVRRQPDGSALVLIPDGNGGLKAMTGVFDDAAVPAPDPVPDPAAAPA